MLILGASGFIGERILNSAISKHLDVIGTFNNAHINNNHQLIRFNLEKDNLTELTPILKQSKSKVAIICSAIANIDKCFEYKKNAININTDATIKIIDELVNLDYKIIYLSTDNVFDGDKGYYIETDKVSPVNIYGYTKMITEKYLIDNIKNSCILRLCKVVSSYKEITNMFYNWYNDAINNKTIYCIENNILSVVDIDDVVNIIFNIIENDLIGIYHITNGEFFERSELVSQFLNIMNLNTEIVIKPLEQFNFKDNRPLRTYMSNEKFIKDSNYIFSSTRNTILNMRSRI